jgi:hypothetical protein
MHTTPAEILEKYRKGEKNFSGVVVTAGNFSNMDLKGIIFRNAVLMNANFRNSDLSDADFTNAKLERCDFHNAILRNTKFFRTDLGWANLKACIMDNTNFRESNLQWAHLCSNDIARADIRNANLSWSCLIGSNMTNEQLVNVPNTVLSTINRIDEKGIQEQQKAIGGYSLPVSISKNYGTGEVDITKGYSWNVPVEDKKRKFFC